MPLLSIIVPVYNAEKYLNKCIDSILAQTLSSFELILVNDGSKDNSGQLCDRYAKKDSRIRVIHTDNLGVGAARNAGLDLAGGQYIGFVDNDDYIHPEMYEVLYNLIEKTGADMSVCGVNNCYVNNITPQYPREETFVCDNTTAFKLLMEGDKIPGSCCNKLYKRKLFENLRFPRDLIYEDAYILTDLMQRVSAVAVTTVPYYYYVHRAKSITTARFSPKALDCITVYSRNLEIVKKNFPTLLQQGYFRYFWAHFVVLDKMLTTDNYKRLDPYKKVVKVLKQNAFKIFRNKCFKRGRRIAALVLLANVALYRQLMLRNERKHRQVLAEEV